MPQVCVVHLIRKDNGLKPVADFLESYSAYQGGIEHDFLIVFKGFGAGEIPPEYAALLKSVQYSPLFVPDRGFDIGSYFAAAKIVKSEYLCFLNSYSIILDDGWLAQLHQHIVKPQVGIVGATGSCESHYSNIVQRVTTSPSWKQPSVFFLRRLVRYCRDMRRLSYCTCHFEHFPNYHIRTNAFMLSRQLMLSLRRMPIRNKADAEKFESGKDGLTQQICAMGLQALVVGRDGKAYERTQWRESHTFRSGSQENLLVSDNRTRQYEQASESEQWEMSERTWGKERETLPAQQGQR